MGETWWGSQTEMFGPRNAHRLELMFANLDTLASPSRFLDAAVGLGDAAQRLIQRGHWVVGVDLSVDAALLARARTRANLVIADLKALPFRDGAFDGLTSGETLEHIDDDLAAVREFSRVLKTDARAVVTVPALESLRTFSDEYYEHLRRYSRSELTDLFRKAGFNITRAHYWGFPFVILYDYAFMLPLNHRRARHPITEDRSLRAVSSAGRVAWLVSFVRGLFNLDRFLTWIPIGVGLVLVATKRQDEE
jgi:SAM-dependent methyltransferase